MANTKYSSAETAPTKPRETVEEFLARGGKITAVPERTATQILRTFSARKIRAANTSPMGRSNRAQDKAGRNLK